MKKINKQFRKLLKDNADRRNKAKSEMSKKNEIEATYSIVRLLQKIRKIRKAQKDGKRN